MVVFFTKFSKEEIINKCSYNCFYWDENNHLILDLQINGNFFCDKSISYFKRDVKENVKSYHDYFYILYDFNDNTLAIQGFLFDDKHNKWDHPLIEDISKFTDEDLEYIFSLKLIDYNIRDKEIKDYLDIIEKEYPINTFCKYKKSISKYDNDILFGYITNIIRSDENKNIILIVKRYSLTSESLQNKKDDIREFCIRFLKKEKDIEKFGLEIVSSLEVQKAIYNKREEKIEKLKKTSEKSKNNIKELEDLIKKSQEDIIKEKNNIDEISLLIKEKTEELNNTIIKDIKLL